MSEPDPLAALDEKRRSLEALLAAASAETEPDRITSIVAELSREASELEALGAAIERRTDVVGRIEVVLTPDQRARILEATGVDLETFITSDEPGAMTQAMPTIEPAYIEALALKQAEQIRAGREADQALREELERTFRALEEAGVPEVNAMVARLRAAPPLPTPR